ncbi:hypothetical protein C8J57DRAFT_946791, partial [Mycena rebaudengoi]
LAQDVATVRTVLPPLSEIQEAMCTLFCRVLTVPTKDNICKLAPILISKSAVETMINFLLTKNAAYCAADVQYSQENMD